MLQTFLDAGQAVVDIHELGHEEAEASVELGLEVVSLYGTAAVLALP